MSERMKDKRLAEFVRNFKSEMPRMYATEIGELLVALKADRKRISELKAKLAAVEADRECVWQKQLIGTYSEYDSWATSCGEDFVIEEEWHEEPTKYCCVCGGKTVIKEQEDSA